MAALLDPGTARKRAPGHSLTRCAPARPPALGGPQGSQVSLSKHLQQLQQQTLDCVQQLQDTSTSVPESLSGRVLDTLLALQREVDILHKGNTSLRSSLSALRRSSLEVPQQPQHGQQQDGQPGGATAASTREAGASATELRQREAAIE